MEWEYSWSNNISDILFWPYLFLMFAVFQPIQGRMLTFDRSNYFCKWVFFLWRGNLKKDLGPSVMKHACYKLGLPSNYNRTLVQVFRNELLVCRYCFLRGKIHQQGNPVQTYFSLNSRISIGLGQSSFERIKTTVPSAFFQMSWHSSCYRKVLITWDRFVFNNSFWLSSLVICFKSDRFWIKWIVIQL